MSTTPLLPPQPALDFICAICLEDVSKSSDLQDEEHGDTGTRSGNKEEAQVVTLACKHLFCRECVTPWLKNNRTCPVCRGECGEVVLLKNFEERRSRYEEGNMDALTRTNEDVEIHDHYPSLYERITRVVGKVCESANMFCILGTFGCIGGSIAGALLASVSALTIMMGGAIGLMVALIITLLLHCIQTIIP